MEKRKRHRTEKTPSEGKKIRYAVVGLGYIAQAAVLPAFRNAKKNSELLALVSDDPAKLKTLGRRYRAPLGYAYSDYAECLANPDIDAVYIALPNHMHKEYAVAAAEAGKHILCEKPLAVAEKDCEEMIDAAEKHGVKLMTAYRLHFERANLEAVEIARSGKLGEPRVFQSAFTMQVKAGNIRLGPPRLGGGPIYDIGVYCINAARSLFRDEPIEVVAFSANNGEKRFEQTPEMMSCVLRFPKERLAAFTCSAGAADTGWYQIVGTRGDLRVDPAYEYAEGITWELTVEGKTRKRSFPKRDQFAPELSYFSECVMAGRNPEPSGREGLADVRVVRALLQSAADRRPVRLGAFERHRRPGLSMEAHRPPISMPPLVHAEAPSSN